MSISRESFNRQCIAFLEKSRDLDDKWILNSCDQNKIREISIEDVCDSSMKDGEYMLSRKDMSLLDGEIIVQEYSLVYSDSYEVPVMYFCRSKQDGSILDLDQSLSSNFGCPESELRKIVSQVDHPYFFRPFYMIHPCRTKNLMNEHQVLNENKYFTIWISTLGSLIGLKLDERLLN